MALLEFVKMVTLNQLFICAWCTIVNGQGEEDMTLLDFASVVNLD